LGGGEAGKRTTGWRRTLEVPRSGEKRRRVAKKLKEEEEERRRGGVEGREKAS